jgi:uncharacterized membrane protein YeaQ/YmgE (transglycosylase-associated protein family)
MDGLVWWIVVGLIAGWATGKIMKGSGYGLVIDIVLGIVGAVIGGYLMGALGLGGGGLLYSIIVAIIGACLLVWVVRLVTSRRVG